MGKKTGINIIYLIHSQYITLLIEIRYLYDCFSFFLYKMRLFFILYLLILFIFSDVTVSFSQVSQTYFGRTGRSEMITEHATLNNGNKVAVGYAWTGAAMDACDAFIVCLDAMDNVVWAKEISTSLNDRFLSVTATSDGGCVAVGFAGQSTSSVYTGNHAIVYKFDAAGNVLWNRVLKNSTYGEIFNSVVEVPGSGNIACAGAYSWYPSPLTSPNCLIVTLDHTGNVLWSNIYNNTRNHTGEFRAISYHNGKLIATGIYNGNTEYDGVLTAVEVTTGNIIWTRSFDYTAGGVTCQWPSTMHITQDRIYVDVYVSLNRGASPGAIRPTLVSFDTSGLNPICLDYPITGYNRISAIRSKVVSPDEIYLLQTLSPDGGDPWFTRNNTSFSDAACTKVSSITSPANNHIYTRKLSTAGHQMFLTLEVQNGRIYSFGAAKDDPIQIGRTDVFKLETDTSFSITPVNCVEAITGQQFFNPVVTFDQTFNMTVNAVSFPTPSLSLTVNAVNVAETDPCPAAKAIIINDYAAILSADTCNNTFTVDDATGFNAGDTVLMIQMKGAVVDQSNTAAFGAITDYRNAGNYEINVISAIIGNNISLLYALNNSYDIPNGKVQFVRVPYYQDYAVNQLHSCLPWNGSKGGVFAIHVAGTLTLSADIDVSGQGFRGGNPSANDYPGCSSMDYYYPSGSVLGGEKGESVVELPLSFTSGRGASANGGGGGNNHNAGGGGGGNYGSGGRGGNQWSGCQALAIGGEGGIDLVYSTAQHKAFLGGGGGGPQQGGQQNAPTGTPGANGGGLVIISAGDIVSNNRLILAKGNDNLSTSALDGGGGGGAGGSILISANTISGTCDVRVTGGKGGNTDISWNTCCGPGGGGGGGIFRTNTTIPSTWSIDAAGGVSGTGPNPCGVHGSAPGNPGGIINNLAIPQSNMLFVTPPSPQLSSNSPICTGDTLRLNITNNFPTGTIYSWSGPGGFNSNEQNPVIPGSSATHSGIYTSSASFAGCTVSDTTHVTIWDAPVINLGNDTGICLSQTPLTLLSPQPPGSIYLWQDLSTNTSFAVNSSGIYWLQVTDSNGCMNRDTVNVNVVTDPVVALGNDTMICENTELRIGANIPQATYQWNNGTTTGYIDVSATGTYILSVNLQGCVVNDTIDITVAPLPEVDLGNDTGICLSLIPYILLSPQPTGSTYLWQDHSSNTSFAVNNSGRYWLQVTDSNGCINRDTININVVTDPIIALGDDTTICENSQLRIGTDIPQATYQWNNGSTSGYIDVSATGTYVLSANLGGCVVNDTIIITVVPLPTVDLGNDGVICPAGTITLDAGNGNGNTYLWNTGVTTQAISVTVAGLYIVTVISEFGCLRSDSILLTDYPYPEVWLGDDTSICEGGWLMLTPGHNYTDLLTWQNGSTDPSFLATQAGIYTVTAANQCGTAADSIQIMTTFCDIWLPDAFTPNGDGKNDIFRILGSLGRLQDVEFSIYNRWGQLIFHTTDKAQGWDGSFKGAEQLVGTYTYLLKYKIDTNAHTRKGNFHLIR